MQGRADAFSLLDSDGSAMGSCTVTATQLVCDIDSAYLTAYPLNVSGTVNLLGDGQDDGHRDHVGVVHGRWADRDDRGQTRLDVYDELHVHGADRAFSYPAGPGFAAGGGTLDLPVDGTVVTSPDIPVGAVVTLTENAPDAVAGAIWSEPVLSVSLVTIDRDQMVTVTVTNELTAPPLPLTPAVPGAPVGLAVTGGTIEPAVVWVGAGALTLGGLLLLARRRRV